MRFTEHPKVLSMPDAFFPVCPYCGEHIKNFHIVQLLVQQEDGLVSMAHAVCSLEDEL